MVDLHDRLEWATTKPKSDPKPGPVWERIMSLRKVLILLALEAVVIGWLAYQAGRHEAPQEPEPSEATKSLAEQIIKEKYRNGMRD